MEALMSEKQQLAAKCCGLERENEQLAELVGHLHESLKEQQEGSLEQQQMLMTPQFDVQFTSAADDNLSQHTVDVEPHCTACPSPQCTSSCLHHAASDTSQVDSLTSSYSDAVVTITASLLKPEPQQHHPQCNPAAAATEVDFQERTTMPGTAAAAVNASASVIPQLAPQQQQDKLLTCTQHRVHSNSPRSWRQWQEQLPLETASSGGSSSTGSTVSMSLFHS